MVNIPSWVLDGTPVQTFTRGPCTIQYLDEDGKVIEGLLNGPAHLTVVDPKVGEQFFGVNAESVEYMPPELKDRANGLQHIAVAIYEMKPSEYIIITRSRILRVIQST